jgi:hypothetical protein
MNTRIVRRGELDPELDLEYLTDALLAQTNVDLYYYRRRVTGMPPERVSPGLSSLATGR